MINARIIFYVVTGTLLHRRGIAEYLKKGRLQTVPFALYPLNLFGCFL